MTPSIHAHDLHTLIENHKHQKNIPRGLPIVTWDVFIKLQQLDHKQSPCLPKSRALEEEATKDTFLKTALRKQGILGLLS